MKTKTCIDLAERFGKRFRVTYEESYRAAYGPNGKADDPWLKIILCRNGHIFPWGGNRLAVSTTGRGSIAKRLTALPGVELWQDGSDGATVLFDVADFDAVAEIMKPRRKRRLSEANRLAAGERLKRFQYQSAAAPDSPSSPAVGIRENGEICVQMENLT